MKYDNFEITEEDIRKVTNISVVFYIGNEKSPGDCWIANYCDDEPGVLFQNCYDNLEQFSADNDCFSAEIIEIEYCEGIA